MEEVPGVSLEESGGDIETLIGGRKGGTSGHVEEINMVGSTDGYIIVPVTNYGQSLVYLWPMFGEWNTTTPLSSGYISIETGQIERDKKVELKVHNWNYLQTFTMYASYIFFISLLETYNTFGRQFLW